MTTTVAQNMAHRTDATWTKTSGRAFKVNGENYISEYRNAFTGQAIRKGHGMTGQDWFIFDEADNITGRAHSLTFAKVDAESAVATDPAKGDTIRWTEQRNGRKRTYSGTVHAAHPNRWLINLGAGRYYSLGRAEWAASGVIVEPATAARPRLVLVSS